MQISLAKKGDAGDIARIHKQEIKSGFLSSLPVNFLEKLYLSIVENDFCVTAKENSQVVGFIAGTADIKKLYLHFIKKYFFHSIFFLLPKILDIRKIFENIFYINKKNETKAELLTIAVKKEFQGKGIASEMLKIFVLEMQKRKVKKFKVVVGAELKPAIRSYEKNGFEFLKETEVHKGQKSRIYIYLVGNKVSNGV